jgi:hypothetical protein
MAVQAQFTPPVTTEFLFAVQGAPATAIAPLLTLLARANRPVAHISDQSENNPWRVGDRAPVLATDNNLRLAILHMPPGSILVAWNGTTPRRLAGGALHFAHRFSLYLRAPEQNSTATYADLFWLLVSAIPTSAPSWSSLLHFQIDPDCYPMDMDLPSAQRNTVVVSADGATLDYFEVQATLVEQGNPGGE